MSKNDKSDKIYENVYNFMNSNSTITGGDYINTKNDIMMNESNVLKWNCSMVQSWAKRKNFNNVILDCIKIEEIDGKCLLLLNENDIVNLRDKYSYNLKLGDIKKLWLCIRLLQKDNQSSILYLHGGYHPHPINHSNNNHHQHSSTVLHPSLDGSVYSSASDYNEIDRISPPQSIDGRAVNIQPEFFKTMISLGYAFLVTWITAFVMVIVHERVPDMKRHPPLPDIFLDNVPHIPWAFHMCEVTGTLLFGIWLCVLVVHKHRMVLLRRFFALAGTVFLLRCVTMLITSLSVPGTHLACTPNEHKFDDTNVGLSEMIYLRVSRAYFIWSGLGMSIQGVRTCGDYMFSGHTVALTLLNFFITEYTPRNLYFLHTLTWLLNMFGIFFILAAHEHYSIDVFVAFYISSRLFLYYHTLANNQALMSHDSNRTRIWFPMFSYFENNIDGIIPNHYDSIREVFDQIFHCIIYVKDICMLTARRFWISQAQYHTQFSNTNLRSTKRIIRSNSQFFDNKNLNNMETNNKLSLRRSTGNLLITNNEINNADNITLAVSLVATLPFDAPLQSSTLPNTSKHHEAALTTKACHHSENDSPIRNKNSVNLNNSENMTKNSNAKTKTANFTGTDLDTATTSIPTKKEN